MLKIKLLGGFQVAFEDRQVADADWRLTKARSLVKLLALEKGHRLHREQVVDLLWPDLEPEAATNNFHQALHAARRALGTVIPGGAATPVIRLQRQLLALEPPFPVWVDVSAFEQAVEVAQLSNDPADAYAAEKLYGGDLLLEDLFEDWAADLRQGLRDSYLGCLLRLAGLHEARREPGPAIDVLRRVLAEEPAREEAHLGLMRLYALTGRRQQALRQYERLREALERDLDAEPDQATEQLYEEIQAGEFPAEPWTSDDLAGAAAPTAADLAAVRLVGHRASVAARQPSPFVNRERELAVLRRCLDEARAGRGQVVLLSGEPGIGKTRMAEEVVEQGRAAGAQVLWGRCYGGEGSLPYWPWVQIIRSYVRASDPATLQATLGRGAADIARIVPELRDKLPRLPQASTQGASEDQVLLFDSVTTLVKQLAAVEPLIIVLDDLQWADRSSLLLLDFLAAEARESALLVIGTHRELGVDRQHPLNRTLATLSRLEAGAQIHLSGLDAEHVARISELTSGQPAPAGLVEAIHAQTEGNPFFVREVVRLLLDEGRYIQPDDVRSWHITIPQGVRQTIGLRLDRLSPAANQVLVIAAVMGREFDLPVLERVCELPVGQTLDALEEALAEGALTEVAARPGYFRFAHMLVRQTLYEDMSRARRLRLHQRIGTTMETVYAANLSPHLDDLAYHFYLAVPTGEADKAIEYATRAGEQAMTRVAYAEAASHFERALQVLEQQSEADALQRCELLLRLAAAQFNAGDSVQAKATYEQVAAHARRERQPELLARSAIGIVDAVFFIDSWNSECRSVLEEALVAMEGRDSPLRIEMLFQLVRTLANGLSSDREPNLFQRVEDLSLQAVAIAARLNDLSALAKALMARQLVLWISDDPRDRLENASRVVTIAEQLGDKLLLAQGQAWRIYDLIETGDMATLETSLGVLEQFAHDMRRPHSIWAVLYRRAMLATLRGDFEAAERLADECFGLGQRSTPGQAASVYFMHLFMIRREQGRLVELDELSREVAEQHPGPSHFACLRVLLLHETGHPSESRAAYEALATHEFADFPRNLFWLANLALLSQATAMLGDERRARLLLRLLEPYADRNVSGGGNVTCQGSLARYLGLLASTCRCWSEAEQWFERAIQANTAMGALPFVAHSQHDFARMLLQRAQPSDEQRAECLHCEARRIAGQLSMTSLLGQIDTFARSADRPKLSALELAQKVVSASSKEQLSPTVQAEVTEKRQAATARDGA